MSLSLPSLQKISDSYIPAMSEKVRVNFHKSTKPDVKEYGYKTRCLWATVAITCSAVNTIGYSLIILNKVFVLKPFYGHDKLTQACRKEADHIFQSLKFVAAMTTYLFMTVIGYELRLPHPVVPYELRPEFKAPILLSTVDVALPPPPKCEVPGLQFQLFANTDALDIDTPTDHNFLLSILDSRRDLVLLVSPDKLKAYLVRRSEGLIKPGVMAGTLNFIILPPVAVPIAAPLPPPTAAEIAPPVAAVSADDLQKSLLTRSHLSSSTDAAAPAAAPPVAPIGYLGMVAQYARAVTVGQNHLIKEMKYRHILLHLFNVVTNLKGLELYNLVFRIKEKSPLQAKCLELYKILTETRDDQDIRLQHQAFILALREAQDLLKTTDPAPFKDWIEFLAYHRFAGIKLYGYCRGLVERQTGPFATSLTLENFANQLDQRNARVKALPAEEGLTLAARTAQRLAGHFNWKDFLLKYNIPYIYGQIKREGKTTVTVLRHGSPVADYSLMGNTCVTPDYFAFVKAARSRGKNILHIILENGVPKETWFQKLKGGEESHRVQARLAVGDDHTNFYPMALRLDGSFVQPKTYTPKLFADLRKEFEAQMFGRDTGYVIHTNLKLTRVQFQNYMGKVYDTFFADQTSCDTIQDFQAFIVLTYAEMILSLCDSLNIGYLEAGCKDDIDRGGAMKAVITLLHLYRTKKFAKGAEIELNQALENLIVNIIAAPLIVRKDEILESRVDYVKHVVAVLQRAIRSAPVPVENYQGNFNILTEVYQGITPVGSTCRTEDEYQQFLATARREKIGFKADLPQHLVQDCSESYRKTKETAGIQHQVELEYSRMNMWVDGKKLDRVAGYDISRYLIQKLDTVNITGEAAWSVLSVFNQSIGTELVASLIPLFNHEMLGYIISPDNDRMMNDPHAGLSLTLKKDHAVIKFVLLFKIISPAAAGKVIGRVRTTLEIPNHRVSGATVTTTVDPVSTH